MNDFQKRLPSFRSTTEEHLIENSKYKAKVCTRQRLWSIYLYGSIIINVDQIGGREKIIAYGKEYCVNSTVQILSMIPKFAKLVPLMGTSNTCITQILKVE